MFERKVLMRQEGESMSGASVEGVTTDEPLEINPTPVVTPSVSTPTDTGRQSPFSHPALSGMSENEIAERLAITQATVREQGRRLNELANRPEPEPVRETRQTLIPEAQPTAAEYWADPIKFNAERDAKLVREVEERLERIVAPFKRDSALAEEDRAWRDAASNPALVDLENYRPLIQTLIKNAKLPTNPGTIEYNYYTAVGLVARRPELIGNAPTNGQPRREEPADYRPAPPQHVPSNQPIGGGPRQPTVRELTESERRFARMNKMSDADYIKYLEMDERDVINPEPARS